MQSSYANYRTSAFLVTTPNSMEHYSWAIAIVVCLLPSESLPYRYWYFPLCKTPALNDDHYHDVKCAS